MPQTQIVPTQTSISVIGLNIAIKTEYVSSGPPNVISAFISETIGMLNGTSYVEGELIITVKDYPDTDFLLDSMGNLIVISDDANNYNIDSNGNLTYTV